MILAAGRGERMRELGDHLQTHCFRGFRAGGAKGLRIHQPLRRAAAIVKIRGEVKAMHGRHSSSPFAPASRGFHDGR